MIKNWTSENIPDQSGKVAIVTGANSGIGLETARELARKGAAVILAVRDQKKGEDAVKDIQQEIPKASLTIELLDLLNLGSVRAFADRINSSTDRLDLLINNAGIMATPYLQTSNGFESQFCTNHLGHFMLTALLIPLINKTEGSRIVNVSSNMHRHSKLDTQDLNWEKRRYYRWRAYADTKISNLYFTYELNRRLQNSGSKVLSVAAHPGWAASNLQRGVFLKFLNHLLAQPASMGALPILMAATDSNVKSGEYYGPSGKNEQKGYPRQVKSNSLSHDEGIAQKLWQISEEMIGVSFAI